MGMDAKADIFYGYKRQIDVVDCCNELWDSDWEITGWAYELGISVVTSGSEYYLAVNNSIQHFDWDFGAEKLEVDKFRCDCEHQYKIKICEALDKLKYDYDISEIGWYVVCDFS